MADPFFNDAPTPRAADPFVDYLLPPLALNDGDEAFRNLAQQLYSGRRVQRAMEARKFRQREAERYGSALQASPLREGYAPVSQAADQQAERAGAPSVSQRQQPAARGRDQVRTPYPAGAQGRTLSNGPFFDSEAFDDWLRRDRSEEIKALPRMAAEAWQEHAPDVLPQASEVVQAAPTAAAIAGAANMLMGAEPEMAQPFLAPGALPPRKAEELSPERVEEQTPPMPDGAFLFGALPPRRDETHATGGGTAREPLPSLATGTFPAIDSIPLPPRSSEVAVQRQPRGTPTASRPPNEAVPLPPRRRHEPAADPASEAKPALLPPGALPPRRDEVSESSDERREAVQDLFRGLTTMGAEMARAGSQPGASFGGALAQGVGAGGQAFDQAQQKRREDQRRARLDQEEKAYRDERLRLARADLEQQGVNQREARKIARARLEIDQARADRDPVIRYQEVGDRIIGLTANGRQIDTGLRRGTRSPKDLKTIVETAKALSVRTQQSLASGEMEEAYDPSLMAQSLRLLGAEDLAQRFEQHRRAQPLQDGQVVSVPDGPNREYNGQVLQGGRNYRYNAAKRMFEPI